MSLSKKKRDFGTYEAKTHLPKLLARVAKGEQITITRHGVPIARIVPIRSRGRATVATAIAELRAFRKAHTLGRVSLRRLIEEGRR
jgi:prevent-host-death family protein